MLKNYLKIVFRNIRRNKGYSFINITGLAIGMACFILILLLVLDELSFDGFHENADDIYRVIVKKENSNNLPVAVTWAPLAAALKNDFPEIIEAACFNHGGGRKLVKYGDKVFEERYFAFTDPSFFKMFSFTFLKGNPQTALENPLSVVLSEKTAKKYFGEKKPLGEVLQIKDIANFTVSGVIQTPENSSMIVDFVVSNQIYDKFGVDISRWNMLNYTTFVMLQKNADAKQLNSKIYGYMKERWSNSQSRLMLQPLEHIRLYSNFSYEPLRTSGINLIYILSLLAIFILLIACVNFMNLSTARSAKRMQEVGLRKVIGANKRQLVRQFLGESILFALIALIFAIVLVELALPYLNQLSFKEMSLYSALTPAMVLGLFGIALITGVIAGSYPAFFLSSFKLVQVLKGPMHKGAKGSMLRKFLAISQFAVSILLIIGTIILYKQLHYIQHANLGYDKDHLVCIPMNDDIKKNYNAVKNELLKDSGIINLTAALNLPNWRWPSFSVSYKEGTDTLKEVSLHNCAVDYDYFKTFNMKIIQGRSFSRKFPSDLTSAFIINEEAVKHMEMENPLGKYLSVLGNKGNIIGVVKNFHFDNFRNKIKPLVIYLAPQETYYMIIRVQANNIPGTLNFIQRQWKSFAPDYPFEFTFMDEQFNRMYMMEIGLGKGVSVFTVLAIFISCMGLYGLASFMTQQRTKEIGIRKVLGASVSGIVQLLSKEFVKWVLVANFIAWPLAFLGMSKWLQNYVYRTPIGIWPFLLAGVLALLIAIFSVGSQSIKTAKTNPMEALRYE